MNNKIFKKNNIPNILTILRILFIPFILVFLTVPFGPTLYSYTIFKGNEFWELSTNVNLSYLLGAILFLLASLTDFLDGYISRKYNYVSIFGKIWDPIADKALTTSTFFALSVAKIVPWSFIICMVIRDLIVDGYRSYLATLNIVVPANFFGKMKTVCQICAIIVVLFIFNGKLKEQNILHNNSFFLIQNLFVMLSTITSIISGIIYLVRAIKMVSESKLKKENSDK